MSALLRKMRQLSCHGLTVIPEFINVSQLWSREEQYCAGENNVRGKWTNEEDGRGKEKIVEQETKHLFYAVRNPVLYHSTKTRLPHESDLKGTRGTHAHKRYYTPKLPYKIRKVEWKDTWCGEISVWHLVSTKRCPPLTELAARSKGDGTKWDFYSYVKLVRTEFTKCL
jgi:hypothetical protein